MIGGDREAGTKGRKRHVVGLLMVIILLGWSGYGQTGSSKKTSEIPSRAQVGRAEISVNLRIVPFYAVDKQGNPVTDLRADEIELYVDGKRVKLAYFDRYIFERKEESEASQKVEVAETQPPPAVEAPRTPKSSAPRQVFLLMDLAFSSRRGFLKSRELAVDITSQLFDNDRVYLLTYSMMRGLRRVWGPVSGRKKVREQLMRSLGLWKTLNRPTSTRPVAVASSRLTPIESMTPETTQTDNRQQDNTNQLSMRAEADAEILAFLTQTQKFNTHTYRQAAERLADSLKALAATLKPVPGPKLLVLFSQGVQNRVYFGAAYTNTPMSPTVQDIVRQGPFFQDDRLGSSFLHDRFRRALQELVDAGVMMMVVNSEGGITSFDQATGGENALRHMARTTDGLYIGGSLKEVLQRKVINWTTAYYEASFIMKKPSPKGKRHKVKIKIKRPGVEIWSLKRIRDPKAYRYLSKNEQQVFVTQLIYRGPYDLGLRPADAEFFELEGRPFSETTEQRRTAIYDYPWPNDLLKRKVDLYSIIIQSDKQARLGPPLRVTRKELKPRGGNLTVEEDIPWERPVVWGLVLVDRKSGKTYWKRWYITPAVPSGS